MTDSHITRHGEHFATEIDEDQIHTHKVRVSSQDSEPVYTAITTDDMEGLIATNNAILKQLKIMNMHLAMISDNFISADDI